MHVNFFVTNTEGQWKKKMVSRFQRNGRNVSVGLNFWKASISTWKNCFSLLAL